MGPPVPHDNNIPNNKQQEYTAARIFNILNKEPIQFLPLGTNRQHYQNEIAPPRKQSVVLLN